MSIFNSSRVLAYIALLVCGALLFGNLIKSNHVPDTRLEVFYQRAPSVEIVTLGTSHSVGFHFPTLGLEGYSFYGHGMDIEASLLKLKLIVPHTPELKCVVLPMTPGLIDYDVPHKPVWLAYTPKLTWKTDVEFSNIKEILHAKLISKRMVHSWVRASSTVKSNIADYFGPAKTTFELDACAPPSWTDRPDEDGILNGYFPSWHLTRQCVQKIAQKTAQSHKMDMPQTQNALETNRAQNFDRLRTIAKIMEQRNGYLYLIAPPTTAEYRRAMGLDTTGYSELIQKELGQISNIGAHDFSAFFDTEGPDALSEYFFDDDHLSVQGATVFSKQLLAILQGCYD